MKNTLVVCGGTGAHVALALVRLHTLGHALGFFRHSDGQPLAFPTIYLVDQDSGDGKDGKNDDTAWQRVRQLIADHPGRYDWQTIGRSDAPELKTVTPLPVGSNRNWFNPPYETLRQRFGDSRWLEMLTSREQRDIRFSHGMMGSPAVGSLLFRLKEFDKKPSGVNNDSAYNKLLSARGRVAVIGSAVGGTGAAVGPTLAQQFAAAADVMAVMVLNWFRFDPEGLDDTTFEKAQLRDRTMRQNANSAFAYYGRTLADRVATVPVGMPDAAIRLRDYTSDTQQPCEESFIHGVAALCGLHHFLASEPFAPGLYQMGAEDPTTLGGGNRLPGGAGEDTVQSLANRTATLADVLDAFKKTLSETYEDRLFVVVPAIYEAVANSVARGRIGLVGKVVARLAAEYREHVKWMKNTLGVRPQPDRSLTLERSVRSRLARDGFPPVDRDDISPEDVGLALFHWTASWIREEGSTVPAAGAAQGGFWPPQVGHDSLNVAAEHAGRLTKVMGQNVQGVVQGFVDAQDVTENGWPDPLAAADYFRYAIEHRYPSARRQLEMLLAGIVRGKLELRSVPGPVSSHAVSLDLLVNESRARKLRDFASVEIVFLRHGRDHVLGFNSPYTLLCPVPTAASDEVHEGAWGELWQVLTGSNRPGDWRTEEIEWAGARNEIRQIRAWIENEKLKQGGTPPPWTQIFEHESTPPSVPSGRGRTLSVYWGTDAEARYIPVALPTAEPGDFWPTKDTPLITEDEFLGRVPSVQSLTTEAGVTFEKVKIELPDREEPVRAVWKEHLEHLQRRGDVAAFGDRRRERQVAFLMADRRGAAAIFDNIIVVDRDDIMVRACSPMQQKPVPGSSTTDGRILYPDYPLRSDYLGLVTTEEGHRVIDLLKRGERVPATPRSVDAGSKGQAAKVTWSLRLAGRSDVLPIKLLIPPADAPETDEGFHRAHWMVWPQFRSKKAPFWRTYYVYERCTDPNLHLSTLWLDPDTHVIRRREAPRKDGPHPIRFETGDRRRHAGGPPLAFSAKNSESNQELGLYLINLMSLDRGHADVKLGLDFGTSHTVASIRVDGKKSLVKIPPELAAANLRNALTLHVSENWAHVKDTFKEDGLQALGIWMPNYTDEVAAEETVGLIPSELLTIQPLANLKADDVAAWQPGSDCVIPFMNMQRKDLAEHVLADFKWASSFPAFRRHEPALREIYLGMAVELFMADVVWHRLQKFPSSVDFTFTYPLRTSSEELNGYQETLRRVMKSGTESLGSVFGLTEDIGIYDESSAAKGGTRAFGEVCLVGDLGGGTLDLFISAYGGPGVDFDEVAASAKIGGNELLRTMAQHPDRFLPAGWAESTSDIQTQLRAWIRSKGMTRLFGDGTGESVYHEGLGVKGFDTAEAAQPARELIARYFRLIVEYMARSLVAFLIRHWYSQVLENRPNDHDKLRVLVQLRGNGWRLWHDSDQYAEIERKIAADVEARARELWRDRGAWHELEDLWRRHDLWTITDGDGLGGPTVGAPACVSEGSHESNPKAAPILHVVGKAQRAADIQCYSHALVQLALLRDARSGEESGVDKIRWFDRLPVQAGGSGVQVEFRRVEPPFSLSHPKAGTRQWIEDLEPGLKKEINEKLVEHAIWNDVHYRAPIAALVWEAVFKSMHFLGKE